MLRPANLLGKPLPSIAARPSRNGASSNMMPDAFPIAHNPNPS